MTKPVGTFPDTLTLDDPLPPPRGTLCEGGRAPRYMLGWVLSTQEARELFSVPENYRSSQVTDYLKYHLLLQRWALSLGLEMYDILTPSFISMIFMMVLPNGVIAKSEGVVYSTNGCSGVNTGSLHFGDAFWVALGIVSNSILTVPRSASTLLAIPTAIRLALWKSLRPLGVDFSEDWEERLILCRRRNVKFT
ncbi:hypothetical protein D9757_007890 [Collybiopsis confluens]|uniref:Uncharacterized protein n=1 Tax=Collybiopsis confluens TaxID=2823264 RepID=A0A8H5M530_9AGAR|nr:hypothetical protein D9757_007890 [Collybiopsis confluens]